jgi:hypothetical protein
VLACLSVKEPSSWRYGLERANKAEAFQVLMNGCSTLFNVGGEKTNTGESVGQVVFIILF